MTPVGAARRGVAIVLAMTAFAGTWILFAPFSAASGSDPVACPMPPDSMRELSTVIFPADGSGLHALERVACMAPGRNRANLGLMLLVTSGVGGALTLKLLSESGVDIAPTSRTVPAGN